MKYGIFTSSCTFLIYSFAGYVVKTSSIILKYNAKDCEGSQIAIIGLHAQINELTVCQGGQVNQSHDTQCLDCMLLVKTPGT